MHQRGVGCEQRNGKRSTTEQTYDSDDAGSLGFDTDVQFWTIQKRNSGTHETNRRKLDNGFGRWSVIEMKLDEMDHKVGLALTDADLCVRSTLTGFMITAEDGSKFEIVLEKQGE